jgi:hypothetical protein
MDPPADLRREIDVLQQQLGSSAASLFDGWIAAAAGHRESGSPVFKVASKDLLSLRDRALQSIASRRVLVVDKSTMVGGPDIETADYYYNSKEERLTFLFPFAAWDEGSLVVVWDSRSRDIASVGEELRRDYEIATIDNLVALCASTLYRELRAEYPQDAAGVVLHIFGPWYGGRAVMIAEKGGA